MVDRCHLPGGLCLEAWNPPEVSFRGCPLVRKDSFPWCLCCSFSAAHNFAISSGDFYVTAAFCVRGPFCKLFWTARGREQRVQTEKTWLRESRNALLCPCLLVCDLLSWQSSLNIAFKGIESPFPKATHHCRSRIQGPSSNLLLSRQGLSWRENLSTVSLFWNCCPSGTFRGFLYLPEVGVDVVLSGLNLNVLWPWVFLLNHQGLRKNFAESETLLALKDPGLCLRNYSVTSSQQWWLFLW